MGETGETGESRCRFLPISTRRIIVHVVGGRDVMNLKVSGEVPVGKREPTNSSSKNPVNRETWTEENLRIYHSRTKQIMTSMSTLIFNNCDTILF